MPRTPTSHISMAPPAQGRKAVEVVESEEEESEQARLFSANLG